MRTSIAKNPALLWIVLVALTLMSVAILEGHWLGDMATAAIIVIASIKSRAVILHYMEAAHAPKPWRFLYETWNAVAALTLLVGHYMVVFKIAA